MVQQSRYRLRPHMYCKRTRKRTAVRRLLGPATERMPQQVAAEDLEKAEYEWDTTATPSGVYQIKIVASDRRDKGRLAAIRRCLRSFAVIAGCSRRPRDPSSSSPT